VDRRTSRIVMYSGLALILVIIAVSWAVGQAA